jgi:hypothetical protein
MELFTKVLKIPHDNITVLEDVTYDEVDACWDDLKVKYKKAEKKGGPETLFILWYGGHGEMGGSAHTQICCNTQDEDKRLFPWESRLNILTGMRNT